MNCRSSSRRRKAQIQKAERPVPQEQDRKDRPDDDRGKSKTRVAKCGQNPSPGKLCIGEPGADRNSNHHAGNRGRYRNQERLANDHPSLGVASHEQPHRVDEPLTNRGPIAPGVFSPSLQPYPATLCSMIRQQLILTLPRCGRE